MTKIQRTTEKAIANYACALMNNTKWREVLDLVGKHQMPVQFSFVKDEKFMSTIMFPEGGTEGDHTKDCTIHGPFFLKEVYAIHCPRFEEIRDARSGRKYNDEIRYADFIAALHTLGQLPLTEDETGVTINAYK